MDPPVVVVGLGGVGSHCAHALLRAGGATLRRLRLVDFDRVSLSSLNRHAVAVRRDVGIPKVTCCAEHFQRLAPQLALEPRDAMFTAEAAEALLLEKGERPKMVVDCIDDLNTKAELLQFCTEHGLPVVSALGSGAKDDPTKICVAQGLRDIDNDPLATKLRRTKLTDGNDWSQISFVYCSQKVQRALLPLSEEQRNKPDEFGSVANFRLRVIPVLGSQPAAAGMAMASQVLNLLDNSEDFWPQATPPPRRNLVDKLLDSFKRSELKAAGGRVCQVDVTPAEASFMVHEVWFGRSALNPELDAFAATGIRFTLTRWDPRESAAENLILATVAEAEKHQKPEDVEPEVRKRIERSLQWAKRCLQRPLHLAAAPLAAASASPPAEPVMPGPKGSVVPARRGWDEEEAALVAEQLSRSSAFLGSGHDKVQQSFIIIVGLGAIGSSAALLLARAGLRRLRLIDGAAVLRTAGHASAAAADVGRSKVEVCQETIWAVLPHLEVETLQEELREDNVERLLGGPGPEPQLILDCMGGTRGKELLMRYAVQRHLHVISVFAPAAVCPADPSRVARAPLPQVWACPAAVALRGRLKLQDDLLGKVDVIHSQEPGLWAKGPGRFPRGVDHRLQLGATAAATALLRITGGTVSEQADPCGMNFWKKLRNSLERHEGHDLPDLPDLHAVGCVADYLWRGRSAVSSALGAKHSEMALCRWDVSKPLGLENVVLMTLEEANRHRALVESTGSLPPALLDALQGSGEEPDEATQNLLRVHRILGKLREHLEQSYQGLGNGPVAPLKAKAVPNGAVAEPIPPLATPSAPSRAVPRPGFAGLVGETKLVELRCLSSGTSCKIYGKAEFLNPGGCQKDRVARQILDEAAATGALAEGGTVVEGTSGSTGISLCLAAAALGYKVHVVMPDDQADEKAALLKRFGATVQMVRPASITSPEHYVNVARRHAEKLNAEKPKSALFANQFENAANFRAHYETTGPELWEQCGEVDAFVMSAGTGGTLAGVGCFLKEKNPKVRVVLADVPGSALYYKVAKGVLYSPQQQEVSIRRHRQDTIAEGIGNDRLTANFAMGLEEHSGRPGIDSAVFVSDQEALDMAHHLLRHEGLFLGSSAAVNCAAAVKLARSLAPNSRVATILCDGGQRHVTKFYSRTAWEEYGLSEPKEYAADDLSFIS